jgi:hypothetical protein
MSFAAATPRTGLLINLAAFRRTSTFGTCGNLRQMLRVVAVLALSAGATAE